MKTETKLSIAWAAAAGGVVVFAVCRIILLVMR